MSFPSSIGNDDAPSLSLSSSLCVAAQSSNSRARAREVDFAGSVDKNPARTQALAGLHTIELNQVIFLDPAEVARIACSPSLSPSLRHLCVVDAYQDSIWGPRIRFSDVESAVRKWFEPVQQSDLYDVGTHQDSVNIQYYGDHLKSLGHLDLRGSLSRIREVVNCEAKVDRIMGGDRADTKS